MNDICFDIVIAGGGLVGATTALAIAKTCPEYSIAVVEAVKPDDSNQPSFDSRAIAIAQGSKQLLEHYGLWQGVKAHAEPISKIHVSDRGHIGKSYIKAGQFNFAALGYVLEVRHLGYKLHQDLKAFEQVKWFCPNKIVEIEQHQDTVDIKLQDSQVIKARLLLVADGGQSMTRQLVNIDNKISDYGQCAVIANVSIKKPHQGLAYERFTESGPLALLPLTDNRYSLVWCVPPDMVDTVLAWDDETFIEQLQSAFGYRAGRLTKVGKRFSYPLTLTLANELTAHRVALVGNASHTIHPIAGQGFNLGMRDIDAIVAMVERFNHDVGSFEALNYYKQCRVDDLNRVVTMTDSLVRLFSNPYKLMALGRTMGLIGMQLFDCLKQPIAYQSMGLNSKRQSTFK